MLGIHIDNNLISISGAKVNTTSIFFIYLVTETMVQRFGFAAPKPQA